MLPGANEQVRQSCRKHLILPVDNPVFKYRFYNVFSYRILTGVNLQCIKIKVF